MDAKEDISIQGNTPKDGSTPPKPGRVRVWVKALPSGGFCRAGMRWVSEEWTMADVNPSQLAALESEPLVAVRRNTPDEASALEALSAEHTEVKLSLEEAMAKIAELEPLAAGASTTIENLNADLAQVKAELAQSKSEIADLKAMLSAATEPKSKKS